VTGVSPAYFISRYTDRFTPADVCEGLAEIAELGYQRFELEAFHPENLADWINGGGQQVRQCANGLGLQLSQFVAHFMLNSFSNLSRVRSDSGLVEIDSVLQIADHFEDCSLITIPLGAFDSKGIAEHSDYTTLFNRCVEKIGQLLERVEKAGRRLALEIMPSAVIGGIDGFMRLCEQLKTDSLGLNFDTGHAWAAKENLYMIPAKLNGQILGTHFCDNLGHENLSLRPGAGSIDWPAIIGGLGASGYQGSFDIEIICPPEVARQEYSRGLSFIEAILFQTYDWRSADSNNK
jgi:sugar phosphate isomerase/epimerase